LRRCSKNLIKNLPKEFSEIFFERASFFGQLLMFAAISVNEFSPSKRFLYINKLAEVIHIYFVRYICSALFWGLPHIALKFRAVVSLKRMWYVKLFLKICHFKN